MASQATPATPVETEREKLLAATEKTAEATNKSRSGKGTRIKVGQTRGKNPQVISWEQFDENKPDTLPANLKEFVELTKPTEKQYLEWLISGYNDAQYTAASDPIAEFVDPSWDDETKTRFRTVVRNFASGAQLSIEDTVTLVKPSFVAAAAKSVKQ
jgi:hypothetical protein